MELYKDKKDERVLSIVEHFVEQGYEEEKITWDESGKTLSDKVKKELYKKDDFTKHYKLKENSKILDIGCAKGFLLDEFGKILKQYGESPTREWRKS